MHFLRKLETNLVIYISIIAPYSMPNLYFFGSNKEQIICSSIFILVTGFLSWKKFCAENYLKLLRKGPCYVESSRIT